MKRRLLLSTAIITAFLSVAALLSAQTRADAIMQKAYNLPQPVTMQATMYMLLVDSSGSQSLRVLSSYMRKAADGTDSYIVFQSPPDVKGTKFLSLATSGGDDVQRIWLPELHRVRRIAGGSKGDKFVGSDLTYYDMSTHHFSDSTYTMHGEATVQAVQNGVKREVPCWVIDTTPVKRSVPYGRMRVWVGKGDSFIYRSVIWDRAGNELKTIYVLEVRTQDGVIVPIRTGVITTGGHKTLLQMNNLVLNRPVDPGLFTVANLER